LAGPVKFGVYIPRDLAEELDRIAKALKARSKSKIIQEALRIYINEYKWKTRGKVYGVVGVAYNHEVKGVDEKLTDIQHEFLDVIVSATHIHLDRERCMLTIIVRGDSSRIQELVSGIEGIRGVLLTRTMLLSINGESGVQ